MNLKRLNDSELEQSILQSVKREREALNHVLHHIVEVERRRLYLKKGYSSLFVYLKEHLKYSNGTAQRRIDAARLMKDFPALPEKLESGDLNLGQVTLVQMALRQKKKESQKRNTSHEGQESHAQVSREEKQDIIESLMGKSEWESQQMLAKALDLRIQTSTKAQVQKDESVRLEVTLSKEQWAKLEKMRELLSTSIPDGSWSDVLEHVAEKVIQQKTKVPTNRVPTNKVATTNNVPVGKTSTKKTTPSKKPLKQSTKKFILKQDACCQFQDPETGKQCSSRWNLQIDHIHPRWDHGSHESENLQILCAAHNRHRYREQVGIRWI